MAITVLAEFRIGEDVSVALDAAQGDPTTVDTITAKLRSAQDLGSGTVILTDAVEPVDLLVAAREASGDIPAGWNLTLSGAVTAGLGAGLYAIDAKLVTAGAINITDQSALILLTEAAVT